MSNPELYTNPSAQVQLSVGKYGTEFARPFMDAALLPPGIALRFSDLLKLLPPGAHPSEYYLRIDADKPAMRSNDEPDRIELADGRVSVDFAAHTIQSDGNDVPLTYKEFQLLGLLAKNLDTVVPRLKLLSNIWGISVDNGLNSRTLDVHARRLRIKLGNATPNSTDLADTESGVVRTVRRVGLLAVSKINNAA